MGDVDKSIPWTEEPRTDARHAKVADGNSWRKLAHYRCSHFDCQRSAWDKPDDDRAPYRDALGMCEYCGVGEMRRVAPPIVASQTEDPDWRSRAIVAEAKLAQVEALLRQAIAVLRGPGR